MSKQKNKLNVYIEQGHKRKLFSFCLVMLQNVKAHSLYVKYFFPPLSETSLAKKNLKQKTNVSWFHTHARISPYDSIIGKKHNIVAYI